MIPAGSPLCCVKSTRTSPAFRKSIPVAAPGGMPINGLISVRRPGIGSSSEPASVTGAGVLATSFSPAFPALTARSIDLTVGGWEPRGAIDADLLFGDRVLRVIATHFGLRAAERRLQANRLMTALGGTLPPHRREAEAVLLMGDLNEWRGRSGAIRAFDRQLGPSAAERTFPSWMPVLALDRIYADGPAVLRDVEVYRSPLARLASDHLPLVGNLYWDNHAAWRRERSRFARPQSREANDPAVARTRLS